MIKVEKDQIDVQMLGTLHVFVNRRRINKFGTVKVQALLAYLLLERDKLHERELLTTLLWPQQSERAARNSLRQALYQLRRACPLDDCLQINRRTMLLEKHESIQCDVSAFVDALQHCRAHAHEQGDLCEGCTVRLEKAVSLYRGDFLAGLTIGDSSAFEEWVALQRAWIDRLFAHALKLLVHRFDRPGEYEKMSHYARRWVTNDGYSEEAHRALMRGLALRGMRGRALAQFEQCRDLLASDLGVLPAAETKSLYDDIRAGSFGLSTVPARFIEPVPHTRTFTAPSSIVPLTPPLTQPIGREEEIGRITNTLADPNVRLVTITGMPGIGKSCVAHAAAYQLKTHFPDGVFQLNSAAAEEILQPGFLQQLQQTASRQARTLLLIEDAPAHFQPQLTVRIREILSRVPTISLLKTGTHRTGIRGEWVVRLDGLQSGSDAVALLYRGYREQPEPGSRPFLTARKLCQLVDCHPHAIQMLTTWLPLYSVEQLIGKIEQAGFGWIADAKSDGARLQRLHERMWSELSEEQQKHMCAAACFTGSFSADTFETITSFPAIVLINLMEAAWIVQASDGQRFYIPDQLREFACAGRVVTPEFRQSACRYFAEQLTARSAGMRGQQQFDMLSWIEANWAMIQSVWSWAIADGEVRLLGSCVEAVYSFCSMSGRFAPGISMLRLALDACTDGMPQELAWLPATLHRCLGNLLLATGDKESAYHLLHRAAREAHSTEQKMQVQCDLVDAVVSIGDVDEAEETIHSLIQEADTTNDLAARAHATLATCRLMALKGNLAAAEQFGQEALGLMRMLGNWFGVGRCYMELGRVAFSAGRFGVAAHFQQESLHIQMQARDRFRPIETHGELGQSALQSADYPTATHHFEAMRTYAEQIGHWQAAAAACRQLGQVAFVGRNLSTAFDHWYAGLKVASENSLKREAEQLLHEMSQAVLQQESAEPSKLTIPPPTSNDLRYSDLLAQFRMILRAANAL